MNIQHLRLITATLSRNHIPYALGGSGLLYSLGLISQVNDWDLLVECPKEQLCEALGEYAWREQSSGDYPFASRFRIQVPPPCNVDVIGGFAIRSAKGIVRLPLVAGSTWEGVEVSAPEVWYAAYELMGRASKAELLYHYLVSHERNKPLIAQLAADNALDEPVRQRLEELLS